MEVNYDLLRGKINNHFNVMDKSLEFLFEHKYIIKENGNTKVGKTLKKDYRDVQAVRITLVDIYNSIENIIKEILKQYEQLPGESEFHKELIENASIETNYRLALISDNTREDLDGFRSFSHVLNKKYGINLKNDIIESLLTKVVNVCEAFNNDIKEFLTNMERIQNEQ